MRSLRRLSSLVAVTLLVAVIIPPANAAGGPSDRAALDRAAANGRLEPAALARVLARGEADVIVTMTDGATTPHGRALPGRPATGRSPDAVLRAAGPGVETLRVYEMLGSRFVRVHGVGPLRRLLDQPEVVRVRTDAARQRTLAQSLPLIQQPAAITKGWTGAGTAVAVIDSGVDWMRDAFKPGTGGCTSVAKTVGGASTPSDCRVAYTHDFPVDDGMRDDAVLHGTNVAGTVLGVAPDTRILALDVFNGDTAWDSDILDAIDWVIANQATYKTRAINLSLGGMEHWQPCDSSVPDFTDAFARARNAGILPVVAAGNDATPAGSFTDGISSPGCVSEAITVGAVYDGGPAPLDWGDCVDPNYAADRITCFSQTGAALDLLAPGSQIVAAAVTMSGTSQAAPHVAGAVAALWDAKPSTTPGRVEAALEATGKAITDARNGRTFRRIDIAAAGAELLRGPTWSAPAAVGTAKTSNTGMALARTVNGTTANLHAVGVADVVGGVAVKDAGPYQGVTYLRKVGGAAWTSMRLNPTTKHGSRVAIAASGARVHVAWVQTVSVNGAANPLESTVLWVRSSADHGATWGTAVRLTSTTGRVDYPTIAASGTRVHVAWTNAVTGAIYVRTSNNGGVSFVSAVSVGTANLSDAAGKYAYPSVAATGSTVGVAWMASAPTGQRVNARVSTNAGVSFGSATPLAIASSGAYSVHTAAANGRFGIAWDGGTTVRYREWLAGTLGAVRTAATVAAPGFLWPMVALFGTTRVGVAWSGCVDSGCGRSDLHWAESSTNGTSWSKPKVALDPATSALRRQAFYPSIVWASSTSRHILVNTYGMSGTSPTYRMYLVTGTGTP